MLDGRKEKSKQHTASVHCNIVIIMLLSLLEERLNVYTYNITIIINFIVNMYTSLTILSLKCIQKLTILMTVNILECTNNITMVIFIM